MSYTALDNEVHASPTFVIWSEAQHGRLSAVTHGLNVRTGLMNGGQCIADSVATILLHTAALLRSC